MERISSLAFFVILYDSKWAVLWILSIFKETKYKSHPDIDVCWTVDIAQGPSKGS